MPARGGLRRATPQPAHLELSSAARLSRPPNFATLTHRSATDKKGVPLLASVDLAGLLEDSYRLAEAGELPITTFLDLLG